HRPERPAYEVELVLDDEVRRTDRPRWLDLRSRMGLPRSVPTAAIVPRPEQPMPLAFLAHIAEQRSNLGTPRHHRELVDRGDHHRRRPVVDLLVDEFHGQTGMRLRARLPLAELALRELVATVD